VIDGDLEEIALFGLDEEEEGALEGGQYILGTVIIIIIIIIIIMRVTYSHLVHDRSHDDDALSRVAKGGAPFRYGHTMLLHVLVLVDDHVFATDDDARWAIELIRMRGTLPPRYLQQHVRPWLRGLGPFSYHVIEA
jgi:hypothetical protein